jgi:hydrogenase maturation protease
MKDERGTGLGSGEGPSSASSFILHPSSLIPSEPGTILVIGYGNPLRSDDGAGPRAAARASAWGWSGLTAMAVHQLTPELAEPLARAELAIFVDARLAHGDEEVEILPLEPSRVGAIINCHMSDPRSLLALAQDVYERHPRAWLVTLPAVDVALGERLSATAEHGVEAALAGIAALIERECPVRPGGNPPGIPDSRFEIPDR